LVRDWGELVSTLIHVADEVLAHELQKDRLVVAVGEEALLH
jgi:hypothetical protein